MHENEISKIIVDACYKIHTTLGRNRKKVAIGVYPLEKIFLPIKYEARRPQDIKFVPLDETKEMNGYEILQKHPTGKEYAHLLEGKKKFPFQLKLPGEHNWENVAAALKIAQILKINPVLAQKTAAQFKGLSFRLEKVAFINGVSYINDSASTTPKAGAVALAAINKPIILLAGGASKNLDLSGFAQKICQKVKGVILLEGSATDYLASLLEKQGKSSLIWGRFSRLLPAVNLARKKAKKGDVVLLSPGCASFGMFKNEYDRGRQFNQIVKSFNQAK